MPLLRVRLPLALLLGAALRSLDGGAAVGACRAGAAKLGGQVVLPNSAASQRRPTVKPTGT